MKISCHIPKNAAKKRIILAVSSISILFVTGLLMALYCGCGGGGGDGVGNFIIIIIFTFITMKVSLL
jgi:hypothetical protein